MPLREHNLWDHDYLLKPLLIPPRQCYCNFFAHSDMIEDCFRPNVSSSTWRRVKRYFRFSLKFQAASLQVAGNSGFALRKK